MKTLDIIIIAVLSTAFIAALIYSLRNAKKGCGGNCAECGKRCSKR